MSALRISVPGQAPRLIEDRDPYLGLTQRQRHIVDIVRSHNGNRARAARQLGVSTTAVQAVVRIAAKVGVVVPVPTRGPDLQPRVNKPEPCGVLMERSAVLCARGAGHRGAHRVHDRRLGAA
jgi:hypothetical protein